MDWVEMTGRTVAEATQDALAELSVSEEDAEIVVLSESKPGLFGRVRSEARVRARVRPANVSSGQRGPRRPASYPGPNAFKPATVDEGPGQGPRNVGGGADKPTGHQPPRERHSNQRVSTASGGVGGSGQARGDVRGASGTASGRRVPDGEGSSGAKTFGREAGSAGREIPLAEQAEVAKTFLVGVLDRFGALASVDISEVGDGVTEIAITGPELALLVGPRGATVDALQDLARVVAQRRTGALQGRLFVDVAGYRQKRRQALEAFTLQRVEEVLRDGVEQMLEPMVPADRKVVHATANAIDGVSTHSEGEEPRRRVVISPSL